MKTQDEKKPKVFEEDYSKLMKDYRKPNVPFSPPHEWANPGDFIIKFSLYQDSPNSITSTDTSPVIGF